MATVLSLPSSPPHLSRSKSSKASSCNSSQSSSPDGILSDISHFEDIVIEDDARMSYVDRYFFERANPPKPPTPHVIPVAMYRSPRTAPHAPSASTSKISSPVLRGPLTGPPKHRVSESLNMNSAGMIRRTITSPSVPVLPMQQERSESRPKSTSPTRQDPVSTSPNFPNGANLRLNTSARSPQLLHARHGSWQPGRRSIKELEAEYHESDDDLPDDVGLWNVPMSPRPPQERLASARSSARGSPERYFLSEGPPPTPLSHAILPLGTPSHQSPTSPSLPKRRSPPSRTATSIDVTPFSATAPNSPASRKSLRNLRAKSWTLAMAELSEEAKVLTEALEYHAGVAEQQREENMQTGFKSPKDNLKSGPDARISVVELPPVQKSNLDFMPVSKEKEAILSRTRPSWLPPKNPREEKKHLKEYFRLMAASAEAEKKREEILRMQRCQKDDTREALNRIWDQYVNPSWEAVVSEHRTRELWWRGVSPKVRGKVWERAVGNSLALADKSYEKALQRAKDIEAKKLEELGEKEKVMLDWFSDIEKDVDTAFPELNMFQKHGPMWQDLVDVCKAYSCYRSDVGYVYGLQLISALLLLQFPTPSSAFVCLANCLNRPVPHAFLTNNSVSTSQTYDLVRSALAANSPRLSHVLFGSEESGGLGMTGESVFEPMFRSLFTNGLDLDRLVRVWDCWVFEGDHILVRTAVATLGCLENQISGLEGSAAAKRKLVNEMLGWGPTGRQGGYWDVDARGDQDEFMNDVRNADQKARKADK